MGSSKSRGKLWSAAAKDWAELAKPADQPLWEVMLDSADVRLDTRFLDLGCGGGGASVLAAGRGAQIVGLDAAEALIQISHQRVLRDDVTHGAFSRASSSGITATRRVAGEGRDSARCGTLSNR